MEAKVEKDAVCHGSYSKCTAIEYLTTEALKVFEDIRIKGQVIRTMKYADDLVLLTEGETVLQDMIDRLIEIGGRFGMERNVEKRKGNLRATTRNTEYDRSKNIQRMRNISTIWVAW